MQNIDIKGVVVWTIYNSKNGPSNAYKKFSDSLCQNPPREANANIVSQASSVVRSVIANMEINDVLSKRETLRNKVKDALRKQLQQLGIFLETIEIKDLRIQNG